MYNIKATQKGQVLTLEVDLSEAHGETEKGNVKIASTQGNTSMFNEKVGTFQVGLNVYRPRSAK